jgi:hypothetical protein
VENGRKDAGFSSISIILDGYISEAEAKELHDRCRLGFKKGENLSKG